MNKLPKELIIHIYSFDSTYHNIFKLIKQELKQKKKFEILNNIIKYLQYKPLYILPKYFKKNTSNSIIFHYIK